MTLLWTNSKLTQVIVCPLQAAVMQIQMNEAELNDLSQAREPSSKKNSEKYRVSD